MAVPQNVHDVPAASQQRLMVVSIVGTSRSGSTILDVLLGQHPAVVDVGELANVYRYGVLEEQFCSCGERVLACTFWSAVLARFSTLVGNGDFRRQERLQSLFERRRYLPLHLAAGPLLADRRGAYLRQLTALYRAIAETSAKSIVVDSSKSLCRTLWLQDAARAGLIDLRVIHTVRDGRGVVWSLKQPWDKDPKSGRQVSFKGQSAWRSTLGWVSHNMECDLLRRRVGPSHARLLRYEDLCADPEGQMLALAEFLGVDPDPFRKLFREPQPELAMPHLVAGSRMRMQKRLAFKSDLAWMTNLPRKDVVAFWLLAGWYARRHGYRKSVEVHGNP